jgi:hypothetical protein
MPTPKLAPLFTYGERQSLEALVRKRTAPQSLAPQAWIVLVCQEKSGFAPVGLAEAIGLLANASDYAARGSASAHRLRGRFPRRRARDRPWAAL